MVTIFLYEKWILCMCQPQKSCASACIIVSLWHTKNACVYNMVVLIMAQQNTWTWLLCHYQCIFSYLSLQVYIYHMCYKSMQFFQFGMAMHCHLYTYCLKLWIPTFFLDFWDRWHGHKPYSCYSSLKRVRLVSQCAHKELKKLKKMISIIFMLLLHFIKW